MYYFYTLKYTMHLYRFTYLLKRNYFINFKKMFISNQ